MLRLHFLAWVSIGLTIGCGSRTGGRTTPVTQPLLTASIAGQSVALLPLTMVVADPQLGDSTLVYERVALVQYGDSIVADALLTRAPEIEWISPTELRRIAKRGGGLVPDPDRLGQSVMRSWSLKTVPDPLRSNLRKLVSVAGGGRYALIPAALTLEPGTDGQVDGNLTVLLADSRTGRVVWRSLAKGTGDTAAEAVARAVETMFPPEGN